MVLDFEPEHPNLATKIEKALCAELDDHNLVVIPALTSEKDQEGWCHLIKKHISSPQDNASALLHAVMNRRVVGTADKLPPKGMILENREVCRDKLMRIMGGKDHWGDNLKELWQNALVASRSKGKTLKEQEKPQNRLATEQTGRDLPNNGSGSCRSCTNAQKSIFTKTPATVDISTTAAYAIYTYFTAKYYYKAYRR